MPVDRLIRRGELEHLVGLSRSSIYERVKDGRFPAPVRLTEKSVAWRESDIKKWVESRERVQPGTEAS